MADSNDGLLYRLRAYLDLIRELKSEKYFNDNYSEFRLSHLSSQANDVSI